MGEEIWENQGENIFMKIVSFTPIKLNNQRLPGKNTMLLGNPGKPLCHYLFSTLQKIDLIDEKYVYCSDDEIRKYLLDGLTYLKRDKRLDGPEVKGLQICESFVNNVFADIYVLCHVTAPFIRAESIENALKQMIDGDYDSAFTAEFAQDYCWYDGKPVNYDLYNIVQTQHLKPVCIEKGEVFIFRREVFQNMRRRIGVKPYIQAISAFEAVDIDTPEDFSFAQAIASYLNQGETR